MTFSRQSRSFIALVLGALNPSALFAIAMSMIDPGILFAIWMPVLTVRSVSIVRSIWTSFVQRTSIKIFGMSYWFKVSRTKTISMSTQMIEFKTFRFWLNVQLKRNNVSVLDFLLFRSELSITSGFATIPNFTGVLTPMLQRIVNEILQPLFQVFKTGKLVSHSCASLRRVCMPHVASNDVGLFHYKPIGEEIFA